jgi:hypothetical protein
MEIKLSASNRQPVGFIALALFVATSAASAYQMRSTSNGGSRSKDGSTCNVYCDNGQLAGSMIWNGTVWTDGVKSDPDMNAEGRKICAANGSSCR